MLISDIVRLYVCASCPTKSRDRIREQKMSLRKSNFAIGQYLFSPLSGRWTVATIRIHEDYNLMVNKIVKPNLYFFPK